MKFFTATIATIFAGVALAAPTVEQRQTYTPCTGLYGTSQCCATDVLGVADLDCANPPSVPANATDFTNICAAIGQRARTQGGIKEAWRFLTILRLSVSNRLFMKVAGRQNP
ncbi:hydrophobin 2 [Hypoxylon sp. EC38]|nr:hydrophobin 2 [Hypoxylon sp. EC38]